MSKILPISERYARKCDHCGEGMSEGFLDDGQYNCSEKCLLASNNERAAQTPPFKEYTMEDWAEDCEKLPDDCYWTTWHEIEDDENYYNAEGVEFNGLTHKSLIDEAEKLLEDAGFVSPCRWCIGDVEMQGFECDDGMAREIVTEAMEGDYVTEQINEAISQACQERNLTETEK